MPRVDSEFNVNTAPENTFVLGSSMGSLVSFYLFKAHPEILGTCGCISSHFTWSAQMVERFFGRDPQQAEPMPPHAARYRGRR